MKEHTDANKKFCHKELERCRGFLIYVSRTYRPWLFADVEALSKMTQFAAPPRVVWRSRRTVSAKYFAGDASGKGFGNANVVDGICHGEFGYWSGDVEREDSNFKELANLVNGVERAYEAGYLKNTELFVFTDNAVAEGAYYNGGSNRRKKLNELVFRLWQL